MDSTGQSSGESSVVLQYGSDDEDYMTMNRTPSSQRASNVTPKDVVHVIYEDDGVHIVNELDQMLSSDNVGIQVFKSILTHTKENPPICNNASVIAVIMTPDVLKTIEENQKEYFTGVLNSDTKTIMMVPKQLDMAKCRRILAEKYEESSKWQVTYIGRTTISFKRSILDVLELIEQKDTAPTLKLCSIVPHTVWSARTSVYVVFRSDVEAHVTVIIQDKRGPDVTIQTTRINASMFSFEPKDLTPGHKKIEVKVGDGCAGTCSLVIKSRTEVFSDFITDVINPVTFMCDVMGVSERGKEALDKDFVDRFTNGRFSDPVDHLVTGNYCTDDFQTRTGKMYPTLLHFAAHYGLTELCERLLTYPGAEIAQKLRNKDGLTPSDLAKQSEERYIAAMLKENDRVEIRRRTSTGVLRSSCHSGEYATANNVSDEGASAPPLPQRRSLDHVVWSRRMTSVWENDFTPTLENLSADSGTINALMTYHF